MFTNDEFEGISLLQYDRVSIDRPTKQLKYMYLPFVIGFRDFFLDLFRLEKIEISLFGWIIRTPNISFPDFMK